MIDFKILKCEKMIEKSSKDKEILIKVWEIESKFQNRLNIQIKAN